MRKSSAGVVTDSLEKRGKEKKKDGIKEEQIESKSDAEQGKNMNLS